MKISVKIARGPESQPILVVGDSPSKNVINVREVLDRNHLIYNSIILPVKYYTENHLKKRGYSLSEEFTDYDDIFRYVNAVENATYKNGINYQVVSDQWKFKNLKTEIFDANEMYKYRIIIPVGDFAYFAVRAVLNKYEDNEKHRYYKSKNMHKVGTKYSIKNIGQQFTRNAKVNKNNDIYILPILHNSSNRIRDLSSIREFIPEEIRDNYVSYFDYVGKCLSDILIDDIYECAKNGGKYENYLIPNNH